MATEDTLEKERLKQNVQKAFETIAGNGDSVLDHAQFESVLLALLEETHELKYAADVGDYVALEQRRELTLDSLLGWYWRFRSWAEERELLKLHGIGIGSACFTFSNTDVHLTEQLLQTACKHCSALQSLSIRQSVVRNSSLSTAAQILGTRLRELDLTGSEGFDDLGLKALAAYCPRLRVLRVSGCNVSDAGLKPVALYCIELQELEVGAKPLAAPRTCLLRRHLTRLPLDSLRESVRCVFCLLLLLHR